MHARRPPRHATRLLYFASYLKPAPGYNRVVDVDQQAAYAHGQQWRYSHLKISRRAGSSRVYTKSAALKTGVHLPDKPSSTFDATKSPCSDEARGHKKNQFADGVMVEAKIATRNRAPSLAELGWTPLKGPIKKRRMNATVPANDPIAMNERQ